MLLWLINQVEVVIQKDFHGISTSTCSRVCAIWLPRSQALKTRVTHASALIFLARTNLAPEPPGPGQNLEQLTPLTPSLNRSSRRVRCAQDTGSKFPPPVKFLLQGPVSVCKKGTHDSLLEQYCR